MSREIATNQPQAALLADGRQLLAGSEFCPDQKIGDYYAIGNNLVGISFINADEGKLEQHSFSIPIQVYKYIPSNEKDKMIDLQAKIGKRDRAIFALGGYGGIRPDVYFANLFHEAHKQEVKPGWIIVCGLPGYHADKESSATFFNSRDLLKPKHYPYVLREAVKYAIDTIRISTNAVANGRSASGLELVVMTHSASVWALPTHSASNSESSKDALSGLIDTYSRLQYTVEAKYLAVAPCGELVAPLGWFQALFPVLYTIFQKGLPPQGNWAIPKLEQILKIYHCPQDWTERLHEWAQYADPLAIVVGPHNLHEQGVPVPSIDVLVAVTELENLAKQAVVALPRNKWQERDFSGHLVKIAGPHSRPDYGDIYILINYLFDQLENKRQQFDKFSAGRRPVYR